MPSRPRNRAEVVGAGTSRLVSRFSSLCQSAAFVRWHFTLRRFSPSSRRWLCSFFYSKSTFSFLPDSRPAPLPLGHEMDSSSSFIPFCSFCLSVYADVEKENKRTKESLTVEDKERKVCVVLLKRLLSPTLCVSLAPPTCLIHILAFLEVWMSSLW